MKSKIILIFLMLISSTAWSHKSSDSFINLTVTNENIVGRWDIALRDLEYALALDTNNDGAITWFELRTQQKDIEDYVFTSLYIDNGSTECVRKLGQLQVDHHSDGNYVVLNFNLDCFAPVSEIGIKYQLLFDLDPTHRGLVEIIKGESSEFVVFSPDNQYKVIDFSKLNHWKTFYQFIVEGVWHILIGYDHILFLFCLLLPSVVRKTSTGWQTSDHFTTTLWQVGKIVTAFTLAHSITLVLAVLQIVSLPIRLIESAIALSVMLVAVNNLYPFFNKQAWLVAFSFGLIHGFGFASVLTDLSLSTGKLGVSLLGFNLGVEIGQLTIVSVFLPVAFLFRHYWFYQRIVLFAGSQASILLSLIWFLQRAFNINIISS